MKAFVDASLLIYLNAMADEAQRERYENFYIDLLTRYKLYTDDLVLDELLYVSRKKYKIPYEITAEFIDTIVLPYVTVLSLGANEYEVAKKVLLEYNVKPSDAFHVAAMVNNSIRYIISEDKEFDRVKEIERLWEVS